MNIRILMLGKNKDDYLEEAVQDFIKKLRPFCKLELVYLKDEKVHTDVKKILAVEAQRIREQLQEKEFVVVLDEKGKNFSTVQLHQQFSHWIDRGIGKIAFIIGSSHGLATEIKAEADLLLSLSPLTMNHQIVRIVLLEQVYRVFTLLRGMKYHK